MIRHAKKTLSGGDIPNTNFAIKRAGRHRALICGPGESRDRFPMPRKHPKTVSGLNIPNMDLGFGTIATREQPRTIRAKRGVHFVRFNRQLNCAIQMPAHDLQFPTPLNPRNKFLLTVSNTYFNLLFHDSA